MVRILLSRAAAASIEPQLVALPVTPVYLGEDPPDDLEVAWASTDVLWDHDLREEMFAAVVAAPAVRWMHTNSSGVEGAAFTELLRRGATVTSSHVHAPIIAEYVLRTVLDWFQRPEEWQAARRERQWLKHDFREVLGTTWLIVGMGAIGSEVAVRARAFGTRVIGVRRTPQGDEPVDQLISPSEVLDLLPAADVVVLAIPGNAATAGMVDANFLRLMRKDSVLVNVGRGSLIDEDALRDALDRGALDAALLDVAATEPPPADSFLWTHPKVVLTPHTSGHGTGIHRRAVELFADNLARHVSGEPLLNVEHAGDVSR